MNTDNGRFVNNGSTLGQDPRYQELINKKYPKPGFFNSKKIAEELLEERQKLLSVAKDFTLFTAAGVIESLHEGYAYQEELKQNIIKTEQELQNIKGDIVLAKEAEKYQAFGLYDFEHPAQNSFQLSNELKEVRADIKRYITTKKAASASSGFTFNNSARQGQKFVNDMVKLMLRAYNAEAENAVKSVKSDRTEAAINRLEKCKTQVERLGKMIDLKINPKFHKARIHEIELAFDYHSILRLEKEKEREIAAELKEQKRVEAEFKKRQLKLEKEAQQKRIALTQLIERKNLEKDSLSEDELVKLDNLSHELEEIEESIKLAVDRLANLSAGYVYVISNIGSFGEGKIKIGMTRRVDPMERVKELSNAATPFAFDVHLLHYSENALAIEKSLHKYFDNKGRRINMINKRREHFYASPAEVRTAINELGLGGAITTFTEEVEASDFMESINIRKQLESSSPASRGKRAAF